MTPMQHGGKPVALVLGGIAAHIELIENLKRRNFHVVLIDYLEAPAAARYADEHCRESAYDKDVVLQQARSRGARLVASACSDKAIPVVAAVADELGLPSLHDLETASLVTNKRLMKERMSESGIPTPKWIRYSGENPQFEKLSLPCVVKPIDGTGSAGVAFVRKQEEFDECIKAAMACSLSKEVIIEEFVDGIELSVDCLVENGTVRVLTSRERHKSWSDDGRIVQCHSIVTPPNIPVGCYPRIGVVAQCIATAFKLRTCPLLIQLIVDREMGVHVLEVAARLGGGMSSVRLPWLVTGVSLVDFTVCSLLGETYRVPILENSQKYFVAGVLYVKEGILGSFVNVERMRSEGVIEEFYPYRSSGDRLPAGFSTKNRVGLYLTSAPSIDALREKVKMIYNEIDVVDVNGASIFRRDMGIHMTL